MHNIRIKNMPNLEAIVINVDQIKMETYKETHITH